MSEMFTRQNSSGRVFPSCPRLDGGASDPHPPIHRVPTDPRSFHPDPGQPGRPNWIRPTRQAPMSHRSSLLALLSAAGLCWADEDSGDLIGSRGRGVTPLNLERLYELTLLGTDSRRWPAGRLRGGHLPESSAHHKTTLGASAPATRPQQTGAARQPATAGEAAAAFNLNG